MVEEPQLKFECFLIVSILARNIMCMEIMNIIARGSTTIVRYEYEKENRLYRFESDIKIGGWVIDRIVEVAGPRESRYKYDFKNYMIFTITDRNGEKRVKNFYYNCNNEIPALTKTYEDRVPEYGIRLFLENHPMFECSDWAEIDCNELLSRIKEVLEWSFDSVTKISEIKKILG